MTDSKKKYRNIYSRKLCIFLIHRGFLYEYELPNPERPGFILWVFPASDELQNAIEDYTKGE